MALLVVSNVLGPVQAPWTLMTSSGSWAGPYGSLQCAGSRFLRRQAALRMVCNALGLEQAPLDFFGQSHFLE